MGSVPKVKRLLVAAASIAAVCCVSAAAASASPAAGSGASAFVLRLDELPSGFSVLEQHVVTNATAAEEDDRPLSLYRRWGRITGYEIDFGRDAFVGQTPAGPIAITSIANLYRTRGGASSSLAASRGACRKAPFQTLALSARIGDGAVLCEALHASGGTPMQLYSVSWRRGDLKLTVMAAGAKGHVGPDDAIRLARMLDRRIATASAGPAV